MAKTKLKDIVIVLPGITGSVLTKDGKDIWSTDRSAIWRGISNWKETIDLLSIDGNDAGQMDLGDGIKVGGLVRDCHIIPGLIKLDGYNRLADMIKSCFEVDEGNLNVDKPANFFEFAYDWRRDNRVTAKQLKSLIDLALPRWIEKTGNKDAKVILIAHSMGGLISRYYLEVLGGWSKCRALYTLGTPFHGALGALEYLCNGYKLAMFDITKIARSCKSTYQLLPNYKAVRHLDSNHYVADLADLPNLRTSYSRDAKDFHAEIDLAQKTNIEKEEYLNNGYRLIPIVGAGQETLQSARFAEGRLSTHTELPEGLDSIFGEGDGTVPRISAVPEDFRAAGLESFVVEKHGSLQTNNKVLDDLRRRIEQSQTPKGLGTIRGDLERPQGQQGLSLSVDDAYPANSDFTIGASIFGQQNSNSPPTEIKCTITAVETGQIAFEQQQLADNRASFRVEKGLPSGVFRVRIEPVKYSANAPSPVTDLVGIAGW